MSNTDDQPSIVLPVDAVISIEISPDNSPADGITQNTAHATLENAGSYKDAIFFNFNITKGSAVFTETGGQTITVQANPAFFASAAFTDHTSETGEIEVHPVVKPTLSNKAAYSFAAKTPQKNQLFLSLTNDNAVADGTNANVVTALVTDSKSIPLNTQIVEFTLPGGSPATFGSSRSPFYGTTDETGHTSVPVTLNSGQDATVTVTCSLLSDPSVSKSIDVHFKGKTTPEKNQLFLSLTNDNAVADGTNANVVTALVTDSKSIPLNTQIVEFTLPGGSPATFGSSRSPFYGTTDETGHTSVPVTLNSGQDATVTVTCSLLSDPSVSKSIDVHFKAVPLKRQLNMTLKTIIDNSVANGTDVNAVRATVSDQSGTPVPNETVNFNFSPPNPNVFFYGGSSTARDITDEAGEALAIIQDRSQVADNITINAILASDPTVSSSTQVHFIAVAPPPPPPPASRSIHFNLSRNGETQTCSYPNLELARTARVYVSVTDSIGTPLPQQLVYLSVQVSDYMQPRIAGIQGNLIPFTPTTIATTDANGIIQVNIALWRGPVNTYGTVTLFANLYEPYFSGPYIQMFFPQ